MVAVAAFMVSSSSPHAQGRDLTGNYMLIPCKLSVEQSRSHNSQMIYNMGRCMGLITGLFYVGRNLPQEDRFCPPTGANTREAERIVYQYLEKNPTQRHRYFAELAMEALQVAWPCRD